MGVLIYDAKRNIIGGHVLGTEYKIETAFQQIDRTTKETGSERRAPGATEYELDYVDEIVTVTSDLVLEAGYLEWKEFTTSVQAREAFQIDLTGTIAAPGTLLACLIHRNAGFDPRRAASGLQQYLFSFAVRLT